MKWLCNTPPWERLWSKLYTRLLWATLHYKKSDMPYWTAAFNNWFDRTHRCGAENDGRKCSLGKGHEGVCEYSTTNQHRAAHQRPVRDEIKRENGLLF